MRYVNEGPRKPRRVTVVGREDIGVVISEGVNMGVDPSIYCVVVHFPATGEVVHYDNSRVTTVEGN
jgi:hypothetical protein